MITIKDLLEARTDTVVMASRAAFIYIWRDKVRNKYYIGSHVGKETDGYIGSNNLLQCAYKARPQTFKRRILKHIQFTDYKQVLAEEQKWLQLIKPEELGKKYYNIKNVAAGGDIVSNLSEEKRQEHKIKSLKPRMLGYYKWLDSQTKEQKTERGRHARSFVKNITTKRLFGKDNHFYGKKHTEEAKQKMREAKLGKPRGYEIVFSEETKRKIGLNNPSRKPIVTPFGKFNSYSEFSLKYNMCIANIIKTCDVPITRYRALVNKLFCEDDIGKTPRELGYYHDAV